MKKLCIVVPQDWENVGGLYLPISNYTKRLCCDYQIKLMTMEYQLTQKQWRDYQKEIHDIVYSGTDVIITFCLNQSFAVSKMLEKKDDKRHIAIPMDSNFYTLKSAMGRSCENRKLRQRIISMLKLLCYYMKEDRLVVHSDMLIYVSPYDADHVRMGHVRCKAKIEVLSNGVTVSDLGHSDTHCLTERCRIGFIGYFTPNYIEDSIKFFLDFCNDELIKKFPYIEIVIAGRNISPQQLCDLQTYSFVRCIGEVESLDDFYGSVDMIFSCIKKRGGILNKNLEAFAHKKCVIGFRRNFYAIDGSRDKVNCLMADTRQEFMHQIENVIAGKIDINKIGMNAYQLVKEKYSWDERYCRLKSLIEDI